MDQEWMTFTRESIACRDRQLGELHDRMDQTERAIAAQSANIDKLVIVSNRDGADIATLARIAESHERRITGIEENP